MMDAMMASRLASSGMKASATSYTDTVAASSSRSTRATNARWASTLAISRVRALTDLSGTMPARPLGNWRQK